MKKLDEFSAEETGEEWLRELYKVITMRRSSMFRLITESVRLLLFGNGGGVALIIGFMSAFGGDDTASFHWLALGTLVLFACGTLVAALTMLLVTAVTVQEAHGAEKGLKRFVDGDTDRTQTLFTIEPHTFRLADYATLCGIVSTGAFLLGGLGSIVLLILFF